MKLIFYIFALLLVFAGARVITARNPVHAALFLVLAFFSAAGIWMLLEAEFLAITLVLVYVGAVMVLFLFVVMMLDINTAPLREGFTRYLPVGILVGALILLEIILVVGPRFFGLEQVPPPAPGAIGDTPNTVLIGQVLYTEYLYPFELAAALLLVAMIAAIMLTMREKRHSKFRDPAEQVKVKREDRVRLVKMPAEKSE